MHRTLPLRPPRFLLVVMLLALAACGSAANTAPTATTTRDASAIQPPASTAAAAPELSVDYATLPQSKTAEGYYMLGAPDAPILMQHYSDFL